MRNFSRALEVFFGRKRNEKRAKEAQSRLARVEALEDRALLSVAPSGADVETAVFAEFVAGSDEDASVDLTTFDGGDFASSASFEAPENDVATPEISVSPEIDATPVIAASSESNATTKEVSYVDANGGSHTVTATVVNDSMRHMWGAGWYVVEGNVSMTDANVWTSGDVYLILADGCNLTFTGREIKAGLGVAGSLTIYGQQAGTGELHATGGEHGAGIGGDEEAANGPITINGGKIYAQGGKGAAGIGGGYKAVGQNITINGGYVEATGGEKGAGIGGGGSWNVLEYAADGENITINGGTVVATGGERAAGIGGGGDRDGAAYTDGGGGKNITINGGTVTATGGEKGSGIGGGRDGWANNIKISANLTLKVGSDDSSMSVASHQSESDLSGSLNGKRYAVVASDARVVKEVEYVDAKGGSHKVNATVVNVTMTDKWDAGWYVVENNVTINGSDVWCGGEVNLILADGCKLSITGRYGKAGIGVSGADNKLVVYGQQKGTGVLKATGGNRGGSSSQNGGAGIGGGYEQVGENITINGGTIYAYGGNGSAGIGGGEKGAGKNITINKGTVVAEGGEKGAGIGGGGSFHTRVGGQDGENITINGGTVTATGGKRGAGIGGGGDRTGWAFTLGGTGRNITINGGTVTATGGEKGSGIGGGGGSGKCYQVTINGGTVTARGKDGGAGIGGGGGDGGGDCEDVTISGGTVTARGDDGGAGIGGGIRGFGKMFYITGDTATVYAYAGSGACAIGPGKYRKTFLYFDLKVSSALTIKAGENPGSAKEIANSGGDLSGVLRNDEYKYIGITPSPVQEVSYVDANGVSQKVTATVVNDSMRFKWEAGWYVVKGNVSITNANVWIGGDVNLILADGCNLTVTGIENRPGFAVCNGSLTIYGQQAGTGELHATGGENGAGIGGDEKYWNAPITINGGKIYAQGGKGAAGIGGGYKAEGKNITINGGYVEATGGENGMGIGCGDGGSASNIKISANLTVKAGSDAASSEIAHQSGDDLAGALKDKRFVTVTSKNANDADEKKTVEYVDANGVSQTVVARVVNESTSGEWAGGWYVVEGNVTLYDANVFCDGAVKLILADGCNLTITGSRANAGIAVVGDGISLTVYGQAAGTGVLTATGGDGGAGIGGGYMQDCGDVSIYGGTVYAVAGAYADAIGGGDRADSGSVLVATSLEVKAGEDGTSATVIANDGSDLSASLEGKRFVSVAKAAPAPVVETLTRVRTSTTKPTVGVEITTTLYVGTAKRTDATATYQWYRVDAKTGKATAIEGATGSTYTPTTADVGCRLRVTATGTGSYDGTVTATHAKATVAGETSAVLDDAFAAFDWEDELVEF